MAPGTQTTGDKQTVGEGRNTGDKQTVGESPTMVEVGITGQALAVWADFLRFHATVIGLLERELVEQAGMALGWFDVLVQLDAAPEGRLRMQDLAAAVVLSRSGLTRLVDRLERAGHVVRASCPSDRRGTFAQITNGGRAALGRARPVHLQGVADHFAAHLDERQLAALGQALAVLLAPHGAVPDPTAPGAPCVGAAARGAGGSTTT